MNIESLPMMRFSALVLLGLLGSLTACGANPPPPPPSTPTQPDNKDRDVASVERAFAATMAKRDFEAFASFLSEDAVFISNKKTLHGKKEVVEAWRRFYEKPTAPFSWEPEHVEVLDSGLLAFSTGPVRTPDGQIVSIFNSVWRKEPAGWRILFDRGVDLPECPTAGTPPSAEPARTSIVPDFAAYRQQLVAAQAAYGRKDYAGFLAATELAAAAMPNSPRAMYNVACGYALTGNTSAALAQLDKLASMQIFFDLRRDDDLLSLRELPQFAQLVDRFGAFEKKVIGQSATALTLPERDFIPEGLAHDPKTGAFFMSSVHKRKILRVLPGGKVKDFATKDLYAVLGMAIDEKRRSLWACTSAVPEMNGFSDADKGHASLIEFNLDSGQSRRVIKLDEPGVNHMCNDVAVDPAGHVFVSDPGSSTLYVLPPGKSALEVFVPAGKLAGPQGIALAEDGKSMFVADYSRGLFHIDRSTRDVTWLSPPKDAALLGIDGLTMYRGDLIAIQNGIRPHRVLRLVVDVATKSVRRADVLQMNQPAFNEPTLGVVVGKKMFYVANSQWGSFDKGVLWPIEKLKEPVILEFSLE